MLLEAGWLVLRQFIMSDVNNLASLGVDPDVMPFITGGLARSREEVTDSLLPASMAWYHRSRPGSPPGKVKPAGLATRERSYCSALGTKRSPVQSSHPTQFTGHIRGSHVACELFSKSARRPKVSFTGRP